MCDVMCICYRYSDFVVHEIDETGSIVHLTDSNPPTDTEAQSSVTEVRQQTMFFS